MDLKWQMDMLNMRARRFLMKPGRKVGANGSGPLAEDGPTNFALMTYTSSSSSSSLSSDSEVSTCSKACLKSYETLKEHYDNLSKDYKKSQFNVGAYKTGLESVEARLVVYKKNEDILDENIKILNLDIDLRDNALTELRKKLEKAEKERDQIKITLEKFENSSKTLNKMLDSQVNDKNKTCVGYHAVPPPYTGNFIPPKPDLILADMDGYVVSESVTNVTAVATNEAKTSESKPKSGINPKFCTHRNLMEEDFEPAVQHQRRVNPNIRDVIKQEVIKLLEAGLIYPISDSPWVSPVHCVPKKGGFTVVENEDNELIPTHFDADPRVPLILERSFLKTRRALIDVFEAFSRFLSTFLLDGYGIEAFGLGFEALTGAITCSEIREVTGLVVKIENSDWTTRGWTSLVFPLMKNPPSKHFVFEEPELDRQEPVLIVPLNILIVRHGRKTRRSNLIRHHRRTIAGLLSCECALLKTFDTGLALFTVGLG
nr:reverse transcriptase domain-containing protein [Tanacetum cinerariifolium]